jgi:hypothetical protein
LRTYLKSFGNSVTMQTYAHVLPRLQREVRLKWMKFSVQRQLLELREAFLIYKY